MVKVGICGLGFMGRTHFGIYLRNPKAQVVALMDKDRRRRQGDWAEPIGNLPASWPKKVDMGGIASYSSPDALIADPNVELVDITLPTDLHADVAIQALRAGKHVLSEKPMARTSAQCRRIVAAARRARGYYMVAQCIRFWPQYVKVKELVDSKRYGPVRSAALRRLAAPPTYSMGNWLLRHERSGGAALDLHLHDIDFAAYLFGRPRRVYARGTKGPSGGIDHVEALWDYGKELLVAVEGGWAFAASYPFQMILTVRCAEATLEWILRVGHGGEGFGSEVVAYQADGKIRKFAVKDATGWEAEIDYFLSCIQKRRRPAIATATSSAESVAICEAELKSIQTGRPVNLR
ncbi:MAG: Gfo/Idh/MocA family protein [Phycisphaerae bacterium]